MDSCTKYSCAFPTRYRAKGHNCRQGVVAKRACPVWLNYHADYTLTKAEILNQFCSTICDFCRVVGIEKTRTTPYQPQRNGQMERFSRTLLGMFGTLGEDKKTDWPSYVAHAHAMVYTPTTAQSMVPLGAHHITLCSAASHVYLSISQSGWTDWTKSLNHTIPMLTTFALNSVLMRATLRRRPCTSGRKETRRITTSTPKKVSLKWGTMCWLGTLVREANTSC